ncbi:MAG: hypothetical protein ACETWM_16705 [Candidatus Lokiarchaeia archaeon]
MSKEPEYSGVTGGVLGIITAIVGLLWIVVLLSFIPDLMNYANIVNFMAGPPIFGLSVYNGIIASLIVPYPTSYNLLVMMSIIVVVPLMVFGASIGLGFRRLLKGGAVGSLYFACGLVGLLIAVVLILMGVMFQTTIIHQFLILHGLTAIFTPIRIPEFLYTWMGLIVLGIVLIILGVASVRVRHSVERRDSALAAGALSIVSGAVFTLHVFALIIYSIQLAFFSEMLLMALILPIGISMTGVVLSGVGLSIILSLIGFGILLVVSVLWTRIFLATNSSK